QRRDIIIILHDQTILSSFLIMIMPTQRVPTNTTTSLLIRENSSKPAMLSEAKHCNKCNEGVGCALHTPSSSYSSSLPFLSGACLQATERFPPEKSTHLDPPPLLPLLAMRPRLLNSSEMGSLFPPSRWHTTSVVQHNTPEQGLPFPLHNRVAHPHAPGQPAPSPFSHSLAGPDLVPQQ
ncbi:unnamed protein product, partial [Heterosigma akashiwo]